MSVLLPWATDLVRAWSLADSSTARASTPQLCAPLTSTLYGDSTLHVDLEGGRSVRRLSALPERPDDCVRIVFVSDTHAQLDEVALPSGDILCHTGDITFCAKGGLKALQEFNEYLATLPFEHKIVVR